MKAGQVLAQIDPVQAASSAEGAAASLRALESDASAAATQIKASQAELAAAETRAADTERALKRARELRQAGLIAAIRPRYRAGRSRHRGRRRCVGAEAAISRLEQSRTAAERRVAQGRAESVAHPRSVEQDRHHRANRRHHHPARRRAGRDGGDRRAEPARHHPDDRVGSRARSTPRSRSPRPTCCACRWATPPPPPSRPCRAGRFQGKVVEIGASALPQVGTQAAAREFRVKVQLEGEVQALRPGLTCDAEILVAERANVLTVPLQAVVQRPGRTVRPRPASSWSLTAWRGSPRSTTGIIGGLTVEVDGVAGRRGDHLRAVPGPARNPGRCTGANEGSGSTGALT